MTEKSKISSENIKNLLSDIKTEYNIIVEDSVTSTNTVLKQMAKNGFISDTVLIANSQTEGRGRLGRSFYSPPESGLYMSMMLCGWQESGYPVRLTAAAAVAVSCAIETVTGLKPQIKWVNDLYLNGKKICGILAEAVTDAETGRLNAIVLGMGINCTTNNFPSDISDRAGALSDGNLEFPRERLAAEIIKELEKLTCGEENIDFIAEYKKRSMVLGRKIKISSSDRYAMGIDIDKNGGLVVEYDTGETETLSTGEISITLV